MTWMRLLFKEVKYMTSLEREVGELKARLDRLEAIVHALAGGAHKAALPATGDPQNQEHLLAWLKAQGLVRDPTPEERRVAAEWDTLADAEQQAHIHLMRSLALDPPLSAVLIENRR
jgi:hypothetical protein